MSFRKESKLSPKMEHLVEQAQTLFSRYGLKRVTIEEVCREAGISKMTFYRYFRNKTELALFILDRIYTSAWERVGAILDQDISFEDRIHQILLFKIEFAERYSSDFLQEIIGGSDPKIQEYIVQENKKSFQLMEHIFREAQERGEIRSELKIEFILYTVNIFREAFKDEQLLQLYPDLTALMKDVFTLLYYGILKRQ